MGIINTDINTKDSSYEADTVEYDDSTLANLISQADSIQTSLSSLASQISKLNSHDVTWKGEAKTKYAELKTFLTDYSAQYKNSVSDLDTALSGLKTLLGAIPTAKVMKEIDSA